jgi:hypothetical protein
MNNDSSPQTLAWPFAAWQLGLALFVVAGCSPKQTDVTEIYEPPAPADHFKPVSTEGKTFVDGGLVFVPVYSHIRIEGGYAPLTANLTIHNTDFETPIVVTSLRFFDHTGKVLEDYLPESHSLEPMGSAEFFVNPSKTFTETALNFVVEWRAESDANDPVIEAVMANKSGTQALAFVTAGRTIERFKSK